MSTPRSFSMSMAWWIFFFFNCYMAVWQPTLGHRCTSFIKFNIDIFANQSWGETWWSSSMSLFEEKGHWLLNLIVGSKNIASLQTKVTSVIIYGSCVTHTLWNEEPTRKVCKDARFCFLQLNLTISVLFLQTVTCSKIIRFHLMTG